VPRPARRCRALKLGIIVLVPGLGLSVSARWRLTRQRISLPARSQSLASDSESAVSRRVTQAARHCAGGRGAVAFSCHGLGLVTLLPELGQAWVTVTVQYIQALKFHDITCHCCCQILSESESAAGKSFSLRLQCTVPAAQWPSRVHCRCPCRSGCGPAA
jgi:hypothetical protein